jgi:transposase
MKMRDEWGPIYNDQQFVDLFPPQGQPAEAPWRLALVTVMQILEDLSDRQAAEAVRGRLDWKYALSLPLTDAGFDFSVLSQFRTRLIEGQAEAVLFEQMLQVLRERGLVKAGGKQRTDSTHILAAVRTLSRLELVGETLRQALEALAVAAPDWLRQQVAPDKRLKFCAKFGSNNIIGRTTSVTGELKKIRRQPRSGFYRLTISKLEARRNETSFGLGIGFTSPKPVMMINPT